MRQDDPIINLIQKTNDAMGRCQMQVDVPQIYARDRRIRRTWQGVGAAAMVMIVLGVIWRVPTKPKPALTSPEAPSWATFKAQADSLLARANFLHEMDIEVQTHLERVATIAQLEGKIHMIQDPLDQVKTEIDRTVRAMVVSADHFGRTPGLRRKAIKEYQKVVELFPDNSWARVAKQRILALNH